MELKPALEVRSTVTFKPFLQMLRCYAPPKRAYPPLFYQCYGATHLRNALIHRFSTNVTVLRTSETRLSTAFLPMLRCYAPPKRVYPPLFYKCYGATHLRNAFIHRFSTNVTVLRTSETRLSTAFLPMLRCDAPFLILWVVDRVATLSITHRMIIGIQRILQNKKGA
jgi:hypothetical protein